MALTKVDGSLLTGSAVLTVSAGTYANSAYQTANSAGSYANSAYTQANTGTQYAQSAGSYANSAYTTANTKFSSSGGAISGNTTITGTLTVSGTITSNSDITAFSTSDERLKNNIIVIESALDKLEQISGVYYNWNETALEKYPEKTTETEVGVIAQQVKKVLPEVVVLRDDGYYAVRYERMIALVIEGIKELRQEVKSLKGE